MDQPAVSFHAEPAAPCLAPSGGGDAEHRIPERFTTCGTPAVMGAIELLADARIKAAGKTASGARAMKPPIPYSLLLILLGVLLALLAFVSMIVGPAAAGTFELLKMLSTGQSDTAWMIMMEVRLPRTLLAVLIGMSLGLAGATLQGFLRNPLADPGRASA